jgi:ubiquinone/menaquinone biosynthesis C-methylase UbiE
MSSTDINHDDDYKSSVRREWTAAAPGWHKWIDTLEAEDAAPAITRAMLEQVHLKAGDLVLDVGSGYGEPGLSAATIVGSDGHVTCVDISGDMLAFAETRARTAGLANVSFVEADIEALELAPASVDVVLSRATIMYATDPLEVLRRLHAALRPGGRLAVAVWATPDKVAFATPVPVMVETLGIELPATGPGPFALGADGALEALVREAGFTDVVAGSALAVYETASPEACTEWLRDVAPPISGLVADEPASVQQDVWDRVTRAWAPFQGPDGTVRLPCTAVCVSGKKRAAN